MTNEEVIEQLENAIGLIKQDGRDWLDDRDIPILEACVKSLTSLDKIRAEIIEDCGYSKNYVGAFTYSTIKLKTVLQIIDKYKAEIEPQESEE